ncbi:type II toxin-antitoxin system VapC family toxin [bacterium]|nr:type II toxin-antitoxin system VapC family toxin [bacterium]
MPPIKYFLDTHILVWWLENSPRLSAEQGRILEEAEKNLPFGVSDITLAEIGCLVSTGRVELSRDLKDWLSRATAEPLVRLCRITPAVVAEISKLPPHFQKDPADRVITATARLEKSILLTQDRRIIDSGAVSTL